MRQKLPESEPLSSGNKRVSFAAFLEGIHHLAIVWVLHLRALDLPAGFPRASQWFLAIICGYLQFV